MGLPCPACKSTNTWRRGFTSGHQRIYCKDCKRRLSVPGERKKTMDVKTGSSGIVTLEKVINRFDIKAAILRELGKIEKGTLILEQELCQRAAGQDKNRFRRTVENNADLFRLNRVKLKLDEGEPKYYWGSA